MDIDHALIVEKLGGITAVARRLGIKPPSVSGWIEDGKNGIPEPRLIELAADIGELTPYQRWDLLPTKWHRIWPMLVGTEGAPPVPAEPQTAPAPVPS